MSIFTQNFKCSFKSCGCSISLEMPELTYCRHWCFFLWQGEDSSWMVGVFFSGCPNFLSGQLKVRLCWLNCFCTLASRVCFFMFSLSLSLSLSPFLFLCLSLSLLYRGVLHPAYGNAIVATCTPQPTCRVLISTLGMSRNPRASQNLHEQSIDFESYIRAGSHHPETGCTTNTLSPHCCSSQRQLLHDQRYLCTRMSSWYSTQIGCRLTTLLE